MLSTTWATPGDPFHTARHLLMTRPQWREQPLRFDVVAIDGIDDAQPRVVWLRNAFDAE